MSMLAKLAELTSAALVGTMGMVLLVGPVWARRAKRTALHAERTGESAPDGAKQISRTRRWLIEAGLGDARVRDFALACSTLSIGAFLATTAIFGGVLPAVLVALAVSGMPVALYRKRRQHRLNAAQDAWPRIIQEIRLLVTNTGTSIPTALFTAGTRAPAALRSGFESAEREWLLTTDFTRSISVLKTELAHPTGDTIAETLLGAHAVGGVDLESRLHDLSDDRVADLTARKDARAKQAGARFARAFVLAVPGGMALMGLGIGRGRESYQTSSGQLLVAFAVLTIMACWFWASRIMALPTERRVFDQ